MGAQDAIFHESGRFAAVSTWRAAGGLGPDGIRQALATWLAEVEADGRVHAAVGIRSEWWIGVPLDVLPRAAGALQIGSSQVDVLLQLACSEREGLLWALRRGMALFAGLLVPAEEVLGGRIGEGREPFGFLDPVAPPDRERIRETAVIPEGPLKGGTWLLYLRFQQDLQRFAALREVQQRRVMGQGKDGEGVPDAPADAHVRRMRDAGYGSNLAIIRRGFPFRQEREEGLAFLSLASAPQTFARALDAMLGRGFAAADALLRYAHPVSGGVYALPARAWFDT